MRVNLGTELDSIAKVSSVNIRPVLQTLLDPDAPSLADKDYSEFADLRMRVWAYRRITAAIISKTIFFVQPVPQNAHLSLKELPAPLTGKVEFEPEETLLPSGIEVLSEAQPPCIIELTPFDHVTKNIDGRRFVMEPIAQGFK